MNILHEVLRDHSRAMRDRIVEYVGRSSRRFEILVNIFLDGPYRVTQRAAWPLSYCVQLHPELIGPHLRRIIRNLEKPGIPNSVKRNTVRLLQFVNIPNDHQGPVANVCFSFLSNPKEAIAVRVFSMTVLAQFARSHEDLKRELRIMIEDQLPYCSAAFASRAGKILKELSVE
jgi:hypothetical protein